MRLADYLYTITHADNAGMTYTVRLLNDCAIYRAHFPGEPITPGVCIVQMAKELMELHTGAHLEIAKVKDARFLSVLSPTTTSEITFKLSNITPANDGLGIAARVEVTASGETKARISFELAAAARN